MTDKFDPIEHAKMIYQARPDAFTAAAYQTVLKLERLFSEVKTSMTEAKLFMESAKQAYKEAMAEKAKYEWKPAHTAPDDRPILATWITDDGRRATGEVWRQLGAPYVESDLEEKLGMPKLTTYWSFDYNGEDILYAEPTHWMDLPEGPAIEIQEEEEE